MPLAARKLCIAQLNAVCLPAFGYCSYCPSCVLCRLQLVGSIFCKIQLSTNAAMFLIWCWSQHLFCTWHLGFSCHWQDDHCRCRPDSFTAQYQPCYGVAIACMTLIQSQIRTIATGTTFIVWAVTHFCPCKSSCLN